MTPDSVWCAVIQEIPSPTEGNERLSRGFKENIDSVEQ